MRFCTMLAQYAAVAAVAGALAGADALSDDDLDVVDVAVLPDRLEQRLAAALGQVDHAVHRAPLQRRQRRRGALQQGARDQSTRGSPRAPSAGQRRIAMRGAWRGALHGALRGAFIGEVSPMA